MNIYNDLKFVQHYEIVRLALPLNTYLNITILPKLPGVTMFVTSVNINSV